MGSTIGLKDVVNIIKKRFILIMAVTAVITIIAAFISFFLLTPVYQASTQVLVNKSKDEQQLYNVGEIQTNIQLIDTYSEIIKSPIILEKVKTQLNLKQSNEALSNKIDIVSKGNSQIFTIKVKNTDPKLAVAIANSLTEIFQKEIKPLMNVDNVNILSKASLGENPKQIEPNSLSNTIFALWFGGVIGLCFAFLLEFLDNTIKVEADIDEQLKIPVLGIVNVMDNRKEKKINELNERVTTMSRKDRINMGDTQKRSIISMLDKNSPITEQYRTIRTNIQFSSVEKEMRSLIFTSANASEGKSTTCTNIAAVFAQQEKSVIIIDADLRKPSIHTIFNINNTIGLTNVLTQQQQLSEAIQMSDYHNLAILASGLIPPNPSELLGSNRMGELLMEAKAKYDLVIIDSPPILAVADAQILANITDGVVLVISSGSTEIQQAKKAKELLANANARLIGAVLNNTKQKEPNYYRDI